METSTRNASQDASVIIEADTAEAAEEIFLHNMDHGAIEWTGGDWIVDTELIEVLARMTTRNSHP